MKWRIGPAVALVGLLAGDADAYVQSTTSDGARTSWGRRDIDLLFYAADPPRILQREQMLDMARASAAAWSAPAVSCTDLSLRILELDAAVAQADFDRLNSIGFRRDEWRKIPCKPTEKEACLPYSGNAIAITIVTSNKSTGEILDADIEINAVTQRFSDVVSEGRPTGGALSVQDLQNTLTHEFGHLIGLDHNCYDPVPNGIAPRDHNGESAPDCFNAPASITAATMFNSALPGETSKRDLAEDDLAALCDIYGPRTSSGGCSMEGTARRPQGFGAAFLLTFGLAVAAIRARRRPR